ncbi:MAG: hypothetical protein EA417_01880 [Gammaproteobacteria bacterium]|nr:MAG: hypothetical protein EA417_01880 [Gammaproteobacteria bacterium]
MHLVGAYLAVADLGRVLPATSRASKLAEELRLELERELADQALTSWQATNERLLLADTRSGR